jgi:alpha-tubulin suppressor-like RCC1 family protein
MFRVLPRMSVPPAAAAWAVLATLTVVTFAPPALATVGPPVEVRWSGEWPAPARRGAETIGRFEIVAGPGVAVEDLRLEGPGWNVHALDAPRTMVLPARSRRVFTFRAVPDDPRASLVVSGTANGIPFRKPFRLDEERLASIGRRDPLRAEEVQSFGAAPGRAQEQTAGIAIRFRGRIVYPRQDAQSIGADNIVVKAMDADPAPVYEEMIGFALTDHEGYFDFTVDWADLDGGVPDIPDVFILIEAANLKVHVRADDTWDLQDWSSEASPITDYVGNDLSFGTVSLDISAQAAHIFTSIIKADRHAREQGGMDAPLVFVHWPDSTTGAYYSGVADEIHVGSPEEWNEGTLVHEYGHHLSRKFSSDLPPDYANGFCDMPTPSHCVWCPENDTIAWKEGWANWFGSRMLRVWEGAYGYAPLSIDDDRYDLESAEFCADANLYPASNTEGYVGMLLRDIEDGENEGASGGAFDCTADLLSQGDDMIFIIFRDDDPETVWDFLQSYRARSSNQDLNLWHTIENVAPSMNFLRPPLVVTSQPPSCRRLRAGEMLTLEVASNSGLAGYRWQRDGVPLFNSSAEGVTGAFTKTLTLGPLTAEMAGTYDCFVLSCDGGESVYSVATRLDVDAPPATGPLASWGVNGAGTVGDGTASAQSPPYPHPGLSDVVKVVGGHGHTLALTSSGQVLSWGFSNVGELGRGAWFGAGYTPAQILSGVADVAAGDAFGLALEQDGRMRSWGSNFYGQLFTGNRDNANAPGFTLDVGCVRRIATGGLHSLALLEDGTLRSIGYNGSGALGNGSTSTFVLEPQQPVGLTDVVEISAAGYWSMALRSDGTVWTWGLNTWGQLGLGHFGTVVVPTQVPGLTGVREILATPNNAYALGNDGSLWAWGYGPAIGVGYGGGSSWVPLLVPLADVTKITGGPSWAMALVGGALKAWGLNAGVGPGEPGLFNVETNYVVPSPIDVPGVVNVTNVFAGWTTAHALGTVAVADVETPDGPHETALHAVLALSAGPNPFAAQATMRFDLPTPGRVALAVYDAAGRKVSTLADGAFEAGKFVRSWDGRNDGGTRVAAGVYFVRLQAHGGTLTRRLVRTD